MSQCLVSINENVLEHHLCVFALRGTDGVQTHAPGNELLGTCDSLSGQHGLLEPAMPLLLPAVFLPAIAELSPKSSTEVLWGFYQMPDLVTCGDGRCGDAHRN